MKQSLMRWWRYLHKYVQTKRTIEEFDLPNEDEETGVEHVSLNIDHFHRILFGGDQLTVARIRGAQSIRTTWRVVEIVFPVAEDWHAKMCYLKVSFKLKFPVYMHVESVIESYAYKYCPF